ncbi:MAG TPA: MDR family MFS transporter [Thermoanaerobaculia bacterium]|jgi:EmrB/QacA subfamily drug resistance transporter|nr:MDR family MFS transporter [Thermoanaerobaculia bacterium]
MLAMSSRRRWFVTIGVMTGMLLAALESTVVGTAMPTIVAALGGLAHYSWVFSAYLLTSTVTVPVWGKLSDLFGRRRLFQIGVAVFLIGSAACGFAQTMTQLIVGRAVQGLGAGALVPLAMTIIGDIFTLEERAKMQGFFSGVWGLSSIFGPLVGGFITDQLSWRWVFLLNLPVGIAAALIIGIALREPPRHERPSIDYLGSTVLTVAVTILLLVLGAQNLATPRNMVLIALVVASLFWFIRIEQRAKDPVVPLGLFRNRVVAVAVGVGFLSGIAMFAVITFVPLLAQGVFGATATEAGSYLTPLMLSWVIVSIIGGRLLIRFGSRVLVILGLILMLAGFVALATFTRNTPPALMMFELVVIGAGLGLTMFTLLVASQHSVPREQLGITTSLNQFSRSIGGAIGVAILGALLAAGLAQFASDPNALVNPEARAHIAPAELAQLQGALEGTLQNIFWTCVAVVAIALAGAFTLPHGAVGEVHGERLVIAEMTNIDPENEPEA